MPGRGQDPTPRSSIGADHASKRGVSAPVPLDSTRGIAQPPAEGGGTR
jgi:hypothetical protein